MSDTDENPWVRWAHRHMMLFGLTSDKSAEMIGEWCRLLFAGGYDPAELELATDWLALNAPPQYPGEHLAALQKRVKEQRAPHVSERPEETRGTCDDCGGTGQVSVPDPRCLAHWPDVVGGTCAVLCDCPLGLWLQREKNQKKQLSLALWRQRMPDWRQRMAAKDEFLRARQRVAGRQPEWDALVGRIVAGIQRRQLSHKTETS